MFRRLVFGHHLHIYDGTGEVAIVIVKHCFESPLAENEVATVIPSGYILDVHKEMVMTL